MEHDDDDLNSNDLTAAKSVKNLKNRRKTLLKTRECSMDSEVVTIVDSDEEVPTKKRRQPSTNSPSMQQPNRLDPRLSASSRNHLIATAARKTNHIDNEYLEKAAKIGRKRKASHQSLKADEDMSFETCIIRDENRLLGNEPTSNNTAEDSTSHMLFQKPWTRMTDSSEPNAEIMKKVAFLRTCVNYMMCHLRMRPYNFRKPASLSWLMSRYNKQKEQHEQMQKEQHEQMRQFQ